MQNYWLLVVVIKIIVQGKEENCAYPLWTTQQNGTCKCDDLLKGLVKCEDGKGAQAVVKCFCMTTQENNNSSPVVGSCLYTCTQWDSTTFIVLNTNSSEERVVDHSTELVCCAVSVLKAMVYQYTPIACHV